jgi:hypothetical protein
MKFAEYAKEKNIPLVFLYLPNKDMVYEQELARKAGVKVCGVIPAVDMIQRFLNYENTYLVDVLPVFQKRRLEPKIFLRLDTHYSLEGHRLVADQVSSFLEATEIFQ